MRVGVIGISYKSSDLHLRELLAKTAQKHVASEYWDKRSFVYVLLSTCNRTEIYFSAEDLAEAHSELLALLRQDILVPFEHYLYSYFGEDCFSHLARVTAGFDSVILGETEIQRQVKQAYENAALYQVLPSCMHHLFQKSLKIGKEIRNSFILPKTHASMEGVIFDLTQSFFGKHKDLSILFIGHSEINRKILTFLKVKGLHNLSLATRSLQSAEELMKKSSIKALVWDKLEEWKQFDLVICGTNQKDYLIYKEQVENSSEAIKTKLIIDLSMPRSVDPQLGRHSQISLLNIEEMSHLIDQKQKVSQRETFQIKEKIDESVQRQFFLYHIKSRKVPACASLPSYS